MLVYLNGRYLSRADATVSVDDRGFLFGDAVYEVVRSVDGRMLDAERHLARLEWGLREIRIEGAGASEQLLGIARELLERNGLDRGQAILYIQVSRGAAPRRHAFPAAVTPPTVFMSVGPYVPRSEQCASGVAVVTHPDLRWRRCDIKTVNLLPNVLANQFAQERGAFECVLVRDGIVTEATHSNVAAVIDGELRTHPPDQGILPGVTRSVVLELAREMELVVREEAFTAAELGSVEELMLTGTTADVMGIVSVDGKSVGGGRPGAVTRRLHEALMSRYGLEVPAVAAGD